MFANNYKARNGPIASGIKKEKRNICGFTTNKKANRFQVGPLSLTIFLHQSIFQYLLHGFYIMNF
jgi:hypothetical protein